MQETGSCQERSGVHYDGGQNFSGERVSHWKGTSEEEGSFWGLPHGLLVGFDASLKVWYRRAVP